MAEDNELKGQTAVVIGATEGIGRGVAFDLAASGARLIVCSRRPEAVEDLARELRHQGTDAIGIAVDVCVESSVEDLFDAVGRDYGQLDMVVSTPGGSFSDRFDRGPLGELDAQDFLEAYRCNVVGAYLVARAARPLLLANGHGAIVFIASINGLITEDGMAAYGAAKAALLHLTRSLAKEWGPQIRVNAVTPGAVDTPHVTTRRSPERLERALHNIAMGRVGLPADVAGAVHYLLSPAACFVTGASLVVDGGQSA